MSYISECAGGFAFIGRDGKLYIRKIYQDEQEIPLELFGEYKWGDKCTISKVSYENGFESFKFGNDTGNNLWINQENMYIVDEEEVENIYNEIKDLEAYSFEGKTIIDPALDVGDKITIDNKSVIYQGEMDFQTRFIAEISSKIAIKEKQETTVKKTSQKVINRRVQSRIDEAEGKITQLIEENTETSQKLTEVKQTVDGITQTVSKVEIKVEQVEDKADSAQSTANTANQNAQNAQNTANNTNNNLSQNYYTKTETNSQINQKANEITSTVSQTYSTKTETTNAKNEAISSANSTTDEKLENYSTTTEMNSAINQKADEINTEVNKKVGEDELGTKITQNYESVQIAWNKISEFIQFINAQLQIKNDSKNLLMALDKLGMHFYDSTGKQIGDIGLIETESEKQIAFAINGDNTGNSMVWGIKKTSNGKTTFFPIFRYGDYNTQEGTEYGGLFTLEAPIVMQENTIFLGNGTDENSPQILGTELDGNTGYVTIKTENGFEVRNSTGDIILSINLGYFKFGEIIETGTNIYGEYVVNVLGNVMADNLAQCQDISILTGGFYGNQDGYLLVSQKEGSNYFFLEADTVSDKKVKKNIKDSKLNALEIIKKIRHKEYEWKNGNKEKVQVGYIAQELEKIDSNLVNVHEIKTDSGMIKDYTLNRTNILSLATKAIQEQQEQIEKHTNEIEKLKDILNKQQEQINKLLQGTD